MTALILLTLALGLALAVAGRGLRRRRAAQSRAAWRARLEAARERAAQPLRASEQLSLEQLRQLRGVCQQIASFWNGELRMGTRGRCEESTLMVCAWAWQRDIPLVPVWGLYQDEFHAYARLGEVVVDPTRGQFRVVGREQIHGSWVSLDDPAYNPASEQRMRVSQQQPHMGSDGIDAQPIQLGDLDAVGLALRSRPRYAIQERLPALLVGLGLSHLMPPSVDSTCVDMVEA